MRPRMRIVVERESDGIGYHTYVVDRLGQIHKVPGWQSSRLTAMSQGRRMRRRLNRGKVDA